MNFKFLKITAIIYFCFIGFLFAAETKDVKNNSKIIEIENYLNDIKYIKANFLQDDITNFQLSEGIFYLSRPSKLRIDYTNPFEASLYTNKTVTIYYDKELDEISNIRTKSTPLHFLLNDKISFIDKNISLEKVDEDNKFIFVYLKETKNKKQGTLVLKFNKSPINLVSIKLINELDQEVEMTLFNVKKEAIKDSVFIFKNPRLKKI